MEFLSPEIYFSKGFFINEDVNNDLLTTYAFSSAYFLKKMKVPIKILVSAYNHLAELYNQEKNFCNILDLTDIMRSHIFSKPFINYPLLVEIVDKGLLAANSHNDIHVFFMHLKKIIEFYKNNKGDIYEY
jgi:hypothetical protein